jgi:hypothetical protein
MAKLDKDFILLDESVVMHGFRALMSGAELASFIDNPVMLLQHNRPKEHVGKDDIMLPIGMWYDIRVEGDKLLAKPDFDDSDKLAVRIQKKVEGGYMKGASVWIEPLTLSDELTDLLPGQTLPTFTKWSLLEASIVDIPNCRNALAIKNSAGKKILLNADTDNADLAAYLTTISTTIKTDNNMDKKTLCLRLGLPETATEAQITEAMAATLTAAHNATAMTTENASLKEQLAAIKLEADTKKVTDLVDGAITAMKLDAGVRADFIILATKDFPTAERMINAMPAAKTIQSQLAAVVATTDAQKSELAELLKLSGHDLWKDGKLERLKDLDKEAFKSKYQDAMGAPYVGE